MKNMLKDTLIIFVITLIAGAVLGLVYDVTKEPIAHQQQLAKDAAYKEVFADAEKFEEIAMQPDLAPETLTSYVTEQGFDASVDSVAAAFDGGENRIGYVITVTTHEGYGGDIQFTLGLRNDGTLNGISILSIAETAGLGMKAGEVLVPQFAGKQVATFVTSKTGAASPEQIDAISGATITTDAFVNGVNAGLACFRAYLAEEGGAE
nr:RnfABCDGE type electron transport complex subunit G [Lachnospiraceae bacterium]